MRLNGWHRAPPAVFLNGSLRVLTRISCLLQCDGLWGVSGPSGAAAAAGAPSMLLRPMGGCTMPGGAGRCSAHGAAPPPWTGAVAVV